jgi:ubiquinone/menaquinone biosynthesis C-methylase UbiE
MTRVEKRFVNDMRHSRSVAEAAVRRLRHVSVDQGWSYLDVGCGNGAAALLVADRLRDALAPAPLQAREFTE